MILFVQTKGGCGKSTSAMQLAAPWVMNHIGSATLVELDDENHDSAEFTESQIKTERITVGKEVNASFAIDQLIERMDDDYLIADIGGNRTATMTLENLGKGGYDAFIDIIMIPISSAGQDVVNARKTITAIKNYMPSYSGKIVLVITRTTTSDVTLLRRTMPDAFQLIEQYKLDGPLILPSMNCFPLSRYLKTTVWEISENADALLAEIQQNMRMARRDPERREQLATSNAVVTESKEARKMLEANFQALDKIIDLKATIRAARGEPIEEAPAKAAKKATA